MKCLAGIFLSSKEKCKEDQLNRKKQSSTKGLMQHPPVAGRTDSRGNLLPSSSLKDREKSEKVLRSDSAPVQVSVHSRKKSSFVFSFCNINFSVLCKNVRKRTRNDLGTYDINIIAESEYGRINKNKHEPSGLRQSQFSLESRSGRDFEVDAEEEGERKKRIGRGRRKRKKRKSGYTFTIFSMKTKWSSKGPQSAFSSVQTNHQGLNESRDIMNDCSIKTMDL